MLEKESRNSWWSSEILLEIADVERKFSGVGVRAVRRCGDGLVPFREIKGRVQGYATEDVFFAAVGPRFRDRGTTLFRQ